MNKWKAAMFSSAATVLVFITLSDLLLKHVRFGFSDGANLVFASYFIIRIASE